MQNPNNKRRLEDAEGRIEVLFRRLERKEGGVGTADLADLMDQIHRLRFGSGAHYPQWLSDQVEESKALLNRARLMESTVGVPPDMLERILLPWSNVLQKIRYTGE